MNPPNDDWMKEGQNMPFWLSEMVFGPALLLHMMQRLVTCTAKLNTC
jgi:hypothetical protein